MYDFRFYDNHGWRGMCEVHLEEMVIYCEDTQYKISIDDDGKVCIKWNGLIHTAFIEDLQRAYDNYIDSIILGEP